MKKIFIALFSLISLVAFTNCDGSSSKEKAGIVIDSISVSKVHHILGDTVNPSCNIIINLKYVSSAKVDSLKDKLNQFITEFTLGKANSNVKLAVENYAKDYIESSSKEMEELLKDFANNSSEEEPIELPPYSSFVYETNIDGNVERCSHNLLAYSCYSYSFTGGAHGMYSTSYKNVDIRTMKTIDIYSIVKPNFKQDLKDLIVEELMKKNDVDSLESLEGLAIDLNALANVKNFLIQKDGLLISYAPYEIAPYSMGEVTISLKYKDLNDIIDKDFLLSLDESLNLTK